MAIALDTHGSTAPTSVSSVTISVAVANSGSTIIVGAGGYDSTTQAISGVTYNGVSLTQLDSSINPSGNPGQFDYTFVLQNVAAGTHNLVVTYPAVIAYPNVTYAVFSGARTSGGVDGHNVNVGVSLTAGGGGGASITTVADNCIVYGYCTIYTGSAVSATGANQTQLDAPNGEVDGYTTNPVHPAGSTTLSYTAGINIGADILLVSIAPAATAVNATVSQVAASVTATGGTQVLATVRKIAIAAVAAVVTGTGGTQALSSVHNATISQTAATVTATGGTQVVATGTGGTIALRTSAKGTTSASLGTSVTGNLIVVVVSVDSLSGGDPFTTSSVTDSLGSTYTRAFTPSSAISLGGGEFFYGNLYYAKNITGGTNTVSCSVSDSLIALEYSGADTTAPLDTVSTGTATASTTVVSPSITPANNNSLILGFSTGGDPTSVSTGYTLEQTVTAGGHASAADKILATAGAVTATFNKATAAVAIAGIAAFKPRSGGGAVNASVTQLAATVTATGGTQAVSATAIISVSISQSGATITATGGTQTVASVNKVAVSQVAATITASGGTQSVATVNNASLSQLAATVTASGGTQSIASSRLASVAQLAATITATGGSQGIQDVQDVQIAQVAAAVTAAGGTQTIATTSYATVAQAAGTITATGGTQAVSASSTSSVTITQVAATITAGGGTQTVASRQLASITQTAATVTASGGVQTVAAVRNGIISQQAATVTAAGGTQALASVQIAAISQTGATVTATGGAQTAQTNIAITQTGASVTAGGGVQALSAVASATIAQVGASVVATGGSQTATALLVLPPTGYITINAKFGSPVVVARFGIPVFADFMASPNISARFSSPQLTARLGSPTIAAKYNSPSIQAKVL